MRFPRAHYGVKMLLIAEILALILTLIEPVLIGLSVVPAMNGSLPSPLWVSIMMGVSFIMLPVGIISIVLLFVGLSNAKADEPRFRTALILQIVTMGAVFLMVIVMMVSLFSEVLPSVTSGSVPSMPPIFPFYSFLTGFIGTVLSACVMICIASGISNLARQLGDMPMESFSRRFQGVIVAFCVASLLLSALSSFILPGNPGGSFNWSTAVTLVLTFAQALITIVFFARATKMLAR